MIGIQVLDSSQDRWWYLFRSIDTGLRKTSIGSLRNTNIATSFSKPNAALRKAALVVIVGKFFQTQVSRQNQKIFSPFLGQIGTSDSIAGQMNVVSTASMLQ